MTVAQVDAVLNIIGKTGVLILIFYAIVLIPLLVANKFF